MRIFLVYGVGIFNSCPGLTVNGLCMLFKVARVVQLMLNFCATLNSVSPFSTLYV